MRQAYHADNSLAKNMRTRAVPDRHHTTPCIIRFDSGIHAYIYIYIYKVPLGGVPRGVAQERIENDTACCKYYDVMKYLHVAAVHIDVFVQQVQQKTLLELHLHFLGQKMHGNSLELSQ